VSTDGGQAPLWSPRGDEIFYRDGEKLMTVPVQVTPTFSAGKPRLLFEQGALVSVLAPVPNYDVSSDGKRLLVITGISGSREADRVNVVLNWFEEVRRLSPKAGN
jgi:hypothetical protein